MDTNFLIYIATNLLIVFSLMTLVWLLSLALKNAGIVDIFWSIGFILISAFSYLRLENATWQQSLLFTLVLIWGLRLSLHIFIRGLGKGEDRRYAAWREEHGKNFWWVSAFLVFSLQGIIMWLVSAPLQVSFYFPSVNDFNLFAIAGLLLWFFGFIYETTADLHLFLFKRKKENEGKLLKTGLWKYTRHPNYFGEALVWWGFFLIAANQQFGLWTLFAPVLMTFLLMKISGVAMLDRFMKKSNPKYIDYIKSTNAFFPGPKKS